MKIPINLASQPFRRDRALIVASLAVCVALLVTLAILINLARQDDRQLADIRREVAALHQQVNAASAQQNQFSAIIHKPENENVLFGSNFINTLLLRKGISWNQIFSDLEKTLPYNVKLIRIRPSVDEQGRVMLDMTLASEKDSGLVESLKAFEAEPKFGAVEYKNITPPSQSEPLYRLALDVTYAQKL